MPFIYDNLTATVIAVTVTMLLFTIQSRATKNSVARSSRNMMKEQAQTFATWMEKDLERMGENMEPDEPAPFENPLYMEADNGAKITEQFTFYRDSTENNDDEVRIATRYEIEKVGTTEMADGEPRSLYKLTRTQRRREVDGATWGSWTSARGVSPSSLGYLQIDLLDKDADSVSDPENNLDKVHSVRVRFSVVSPFQNERTLPGATHVGSVLLLRKENDETSGEDENVNVPKDKGDCVPWGWKILTKEDGSDFDNAADCFTYVENNFGDNDDFDDDDDHDDDFWEHWSWN